MVSAAQLTLSEEQVREFYEEGFTIVRGVFESPEMSEMQAAFARLYETGLREGQDIYNGSAFEIVPIKAGPLAGSNTIRLVMWCGANEPVLSKYGKDQRLLRLAGQLLGSDEMQQIINQAHYKIPSSQVKFDWHQDIYFRENTGEWTDVNGRGSYVQTLTAIDDTTLENGPTMFVPGLLKNLHLDQGYDEANLPFEESKAVGPLLKAGDVVLFSPYAIHSSLPNRSESLRRVFINGFAYPGANRKSYIAGGLGRTVRVERN